MTETPEERVERLATLPLDTEGIWIHVPRHAIAVEIRSAESAAREDERATYIKALMALRGLPVHGTTQAAQCDWFEAGLNKAIRALAGEEKP